MEKSQRQMEKYSLPNVIFPLAIPLNHINGMKI